MDARLPTPVPDYSARGLNPERLRAIEQFAGTDVLDVGCGGGAYVLHLADRYRIRGVDYQSFESWKQRPELFEISDATRLRHADDSFDTLLSFEALEHLADPASALREYYRVCRQNLILTVPNCEQTAGMRSSGIIFNHWSDRTHVNFWDLDGICARVIEAGFQIRHEGYINRINLAPVLAEAMGLQKRGARLLKSLLKRVQRRQYPMTCLVVAHKAVAKAA
jgi:SAM-dependent methyltransferase